MAVKKLFIALPIYGKVDPWFHQSLIHFIQEHKAIQAELCEHIGDSAIQRARNVLTHSFLASECSDMLFIDTDLVFSAEQVIRLCSNDEALIGGFYPKKQQHKLEWVLNELDEGTPPREPNGLREVKYIGTGFMRINRCVFEKMIKAFGREIVYTDDSDKKTQMYDFWHMGVYEFANGYRRFLSEDWWFCQMWRDLGGKVWADTHIILKHSGGILFPLNSQEREFIPQAPDPVASSQDSGGTDTASMPPELHCLQRRAQLTPA